MHGTQPPHAPPCVPRVERERRNAEAEAKARDVRLQRALEDVEKYKAMLSELRAQVGRTHGMGVDGWGASRGAVTCEGGAWAGVWAPCWT